MYVLVTGLVTFPKIFTFGSRFGTFCDRIAIIVVPLESSDHLLFRTSLFFEKDLETAEQFWFEIFKVEKNRIFSKNSKNLKIYTLVLRPWFRSLNVHLGARPLKGWVTSYTPRYFFYGKKNITHSVSNFMTTGRILMFDPGKWSYSPVLFISGL